MFERIIRDLQLADKFEVNAKRLFDTTTKSPNWANTYLECLGDAARLRAAARNLVALALKDSSANTGPVGSAEGSKWPDKILSMTLEQLLWLAGNAKSAPVGSRRMRQATEQISQVAALFQINHTMAQLLWWSGNVEPVPPGKPVIDLAEARR